MYYVLPYSINVICLGWLQLKYNDLRRNLPFMHNAFRDHIAIISYAPVQVISARANINTLSYEQSYHITSYLSILNNTIIPGRGSKGMHTYVYTISQALYAHFMLCWALLWSIKCLYILIIQGYFTRCDCLDFSESNLKVMDNDILSHL